MVLCAKELCFWASIRYIVRANCRSGASKVSQESFGGGRSSVFDEGAESLIHENEVLAESSGAFGGDRTGVPCRNGGRSGRARCAQAGARSGRQARARKHNPERTREKVAIGIVPRIPPQFGAVRYSG